MKLLIKILFRLISIPFWAALYLIALLRDLFKAMIYFVVYGGEYITYQSKNESKKIAGIWELLRKPGLDLYIKTGGNPFNKNIEKSNDK